jgi:hypothetical protein
MIHNLESRTKMTTNSTWKQNTSKLVEKRESLAERVKSEIERKMKKWNGNVKNLYL